MTKLQNPIKGLENDSRGSRIGSNQKFMKGCEHLAEIRDVSPSADGCEDCLKIGGRWVHLRMCMSCGHVGCCDSSPNRHATQHFHATVHSIARSVEPGEDWGYCYTDDIFYESLPKAD